MSLFFFSCCISRSFRGRKGGSLKEPDGQRRRKKPTSNSFQKKKKTGSDRWFQVVILRERGDEVEVLFPAAAPGEAGWDEEQETGATGARGEGEDEGVLGQDKGLVVAPAQWFGPQGPQWEPNDLFPPDWVVL